MLVKKKTVNTDWSERMRKGPWNKSNYSSFREMIPSFLSIHGQLASCVWLAFSPGRTHQSWNQSCGPKAQTPEIPYARSGHLPLNAKWRGMVKTDRGGLLHSLGPIMGRGRVSTQLIFSHLWGTDMSYRLSSRKNWGQRTKGMHS
jgi:hypothetical protein